MIEHLCGVVLSVGNIGRDGLLFIEKRDGYTKHLYCCFNSMFYNRRHPSVDRKRDIRGISSQHPCSYIIHIIPSPFPSTLRPYITSALTYPPSPLPPSSFLPSLSPPSPHHNPTPSPPPPPILYSSPPPSPPNPPHPPLHQSQTHSSKPRTIPTPPPIIPLHPHMSLFHHNLPALCVTSRGDNDIPFYRDNPLDA